MSILYKTFSTSWIPISLFCIFCLSASAAQPLSENGYCNNNIGPHNDNRVEENACIATKHHLGVTASYIFVMSPRCPPRAWRPQPRAREAEWGRLRNEKANASADLMLTSPPPPPHVKAVKFIGFFIKENVYFTLPEYHTHLRSSFRIVSCV